MRILVVYGTTEGQTRKVATFLADRFKGRGHDVTLADAHRPPRSLNPAAYDAVVVAARVHSGRYQRSIRRFVRRNVAMLRAKPSAFVSVSMMAALPDRAGTVASYVGRFSHRTGWTPGLVHQAAGARFYARQGAIGRWILGRIDSKVRGRPVDTSRDQEWTDWDALGDFADGFLVAAAGVHAAA